MAYFCKRAAQQLTKTPISTLRDKITESCVDILYKYRKYCATNCHSGQLILPEALKYLPLYTLAAIKSNGLREADVSLDERAIWKHMVSHLPVSRVGIRYKQSSDICALKNMCDR